MIYSYNKSQRDALFLNFILVKNSIRIFYHIILPSSSYTVFLWCSYVGKSLSELEIQAATYIFLIKCGKLSTLLGSTI